MFSTSITRTFKLTTPIVNAGMAMIARPALAAAVCEAGGLGTIGSDINPPDVLRDLVRQTKTLTKRPFGVDLIGDFVTDEHVSVLIEEQVALAIFFWTLPTPAHVERLKQAGIKVWMQIGRVAEAEQAAALGADALIVQGAEAGGHNRAEASTMTLFPRIRRRFPGLPLLAAGGIVDGATMAAALVLGADAVWCGSRFLAAQEAEAHDSYKERVLSADVGDTAILSIYGPEWPDQPMRAIVNDGARVALGREAEAIGDAKGQIIGSTVLNGQTIPVPRYSAILPTRDFNGDIEQACLTAGQSAGNIGEILPAGEIIRRMTSEAKAALDRLAAKGGRLMRSALSLAVPLALAGIDAPSFVSHAAVDCLRHIGGFAGLNLTNKRLQEAAWRRVPANSFCVVWRAGATFGSAATRFPRSSTTRPFRAPPGRWPRSSTFSIGTPMSA